LQLHLKRFEYDTATGEMRKLDDAFAFPTTLKLRRCGRRSEANLGR
jgi:hypothetical protein